MPVSALPGAASALLAIIFAGLTWRQWLVRRRPYQLVWAVGLTFFAVAVGMELAHALTGWTTITYRLWYLCGAVLAAPFLGQGTAYLLLPRGVAHLMMGLLAFATIGVISVTLQADIDFARFASPGEEFSGQAFFAPGEVLFLTPRAWTIPFNFYGTLLLGGGAVYSAGLFFRRRIMARRMWGNVLIALGAFTIAGTGMLNRLGQPGFQTLGVLAAVTLLFIGFLQASAPDRRGDASPRA